MADDASVFENDVELPKLRGKTGVDLTTADRLAILYTKPDGTSGQFNADDSGTPSDGYVEYEPQAGDLDQDGPWIMQGYAEADAGWKRHGAPATVMVGLGLPYTAP